MDDAAAGREYGLGGRLCATAFHVQQQELMLRTRGWVLGFGFGIEEALVTLALAHEFGTLEPAEAGEEFKVRAKALHRDSNLQRKIESAGVIIRGSISAAEADRLIQDLAEYRRLRHLMAHRPCWLEGVWDPDAGTAPDMHKGRTVGFRLFIADEDFVWEIDHDQRLEWGRLVDRCKAGVEAVRSRFLPESPSQEG
jgi:hypothetical protein